MVNSNELVYPYLKVYNHGSFCCIFKDFPRRPLEPQHHLLHTIYMNIYFFWSLLNLLPRWCSNSLLRHKSFLVTIIILLYEPLALIFSYSGSAQIFSFQTWQDYGSFLYFSYANYTYYIHSTELLWS